jgi:hypothetical protein
VGDPPSGFTRRAKGWYLDAIPIFMADSPYADGVRAASKERRIGDVYGGLIDAARF